MTLYVDQNEVGPARLGIVAGRRYGNAVQRNRIKRLIREAFRRIRHDLPAGVDCVVLPRPGADPTILQIRESLLTLAQRLTSIPPPEHGST